MYPTDSGETAVVWGRANKRDYLPLAKICLARYSRSAVTSLLWLEFDLVGAMLCLRDGGVGGKGGFQTSQP